MEFSPVEITDEIIRKLADVFFKHIPFEFKSDYRPKCGPGTLPPTIDFSRFSMMYCHLDKLVIQEASDSRGSDVEIFLSSFANSITAHQIELLASDSDKDQWTKLLEKYWEKVGFSTYQCMAEQCAALVEGIGRIRSVLPTTGQKCVVIPVFPIGNIVAAALLRNLYERSGWFVFSPIWNLPRDDKRRRKEVRRLVGELGNSGNLMIHYIDECKSGTNMSKIVRAILEAGWPRERILVTSIGFDNPQADDGMAVGTRFKDFRDKVAYVTEISIPRSRFGFIDRDGEDLFLENKSRLCGWRKVSGFQVLGEIIDRFKSFDRSGEDELTKLLGEENRPVVRAGLSEIGVFVEDERNFSSVMEQMYETQFIGSPYIIDSFDQRLFSALNKEEAAFISANVSASLPHASKLLSIIEKTGVGEVSPIYFLKPWRRDSKLPYNLIRLEGNEAAPAKFFLNCLKSRLNV